MWALFFSKSSGTWICTVIVLDSSENVGVRLKHCRNYWFPGLIPHWSFIVLWQQKCFMAVIAGDIEALLLQAVQRDLLQVYWQDENRGLYCRKSPAEISRVHLQENSSWQQWGLGCSHLSCTPLSCQAVLSPARCCLPFSLRIQLVPTCFLCPEWHKTGKNFSPDAVILPYSSQFFGWKRSLCGYWRVTLGETAWPEVLCRRTDLGYWSWLHSWTYFGDLKA